MGIMIYLLKSLLQFGSVNGLQAPISLACGTNKLQPNTACRRRRFAALYCGSIWFCARLRYSKAQRESRAAPELIRWPAKIDELPV